MSASRSARRLRFVNCRICMIQCAGSQNRKSAIAVSSRGCDEAYPLTTRRVRLRAARSAGTPMTSRCRTAAADRTDRTGGRRGAAAPAAPGIARAPVPRPRTTTGRSRSTASDHRSRRAATPGWIPSALGRPPLSSRSQLYQPARSQPICTSHDHTVDGGASIVTAIVPPRLLDGISSAPGNGAATSSSVAPQRRHLGHMNPRYRPSD